MNFRLLKSSEIDIRIATVKENGLSLLLYKDARVDQNILDETLGNEYWQRDHKELKGVIYCGVGVYNQKLNQWVWKWDAGSESFSDKEKGEASDSFKRACFNVGIGRELYTAPFIWVSSEKAKIKDSGRKDKNGNIIYTCYDDFKVKEISYNSNNEIDKIIIVNSKSGEIVFNSFAKNETKKEIEYATPEQIAELKTLVADLDAVAKYLKKDNINALTKVEIQNIIDRKKKAN